MPFMFEGVKDDTIVYNFMKKVITRGYNIDENPYKADK